MNVTTAKPSPTQHTKRQNGLYPVNSQSILSKTVAGSDKKVSAKAIAIVNHNHNHNHTNANNELNYSTLKCQNNAKNQSAYAKSLSNGLKSTVPLAKPPNPRPPNKFNCCRNCVIRDPDDANGRRPSAGVVSMPKLKCDPRPPLSHAMDPTSTDSDKVSMDTKRSASILAASLRRNSIDAFRLLRKPAFRQSLDDDYSLANVRRQSFDDIAFKAHAKSYGAHNGTTNGDYAMPANGTGNGRKLIKHMSLDEYGDATTRLRKLEMKMRKHKVNVLRYVNGKEATNGHSMDARKLLDYQVGTGTAPMKGDPFARVRSDCVYPKIGVENVLHVKGQSQQRRATTNGSYGIITASELHKLRTSAERIS